MNFNLIMENWRRFSRKVNERVEGSRFLGRDYDKDPLTDEEMELLASDGDEGINARAEMLQHITDTRELPDMSQKAGIQIGLMASQDSKFYNIFGAIKKKYMSSYKGGKGGASSANQQADEKDADDFSVQRQIKAYQYKPSLSVKYGRKIIIVNSLARMGINVGLQKRLSARLDGKSGAGWTGQGAPETDRDKARENQKLIVGTRDQNPAGFVQVPTGPWYHGAADDAHESFSVRGGQAAGTPAYWQSAFVYHTRGDLAAAAEEGPMQWDDWDPLTLDILVYKWSPSEDYDTPGGVLEEYTEVEEGLLVRPAQFQGFFIELDNNKKIKVIRMSNDEAEKMIKTGNFR